MMETQLHSWLCHHFCGRVTAAKLASCQAREPGSTAVQTTYVGSLGLGGLLVTKLPSLGPC